MSCAAVATGKLAQLLCSDCRKPDERLHELESVQMCCLHCCSLHDLRHMACCGVLHAQGGAWRETWTERMGYTSNALDTTIERNAHKWAHDPSVSIDEAVGSLHTGLAAQRMLLAWSFAILLWRIRGDKGSSVCISCI